MYFTSYLKYAIVFVVMIVLQVSFMWLLAISNYNITPDLVILVVIFLGYAKGQTAGMVSGFISGLTLDILSGSFIGLSALCYCIAGFISGFLGGHTFGAGEKKTSLTGIIFLCTLIAYSIFFVIYLQGSSISIEDIFLKYVITTTVYTSVFGLILSLVFNRFDLKKTF